MENIYAGRIEALRALMRAKDWDAAIIGGSDPHGSEYPPERYRQVAWLSGFGGEAATLVICADHAGLWTDSRYFIQAVQELEGTGVELHKLGTSQPDIPHWLPEYFGDGAEVTIAMDSLATGAKFADTVRKSFEGSGGNCLIAAVPDLLGSIWEDRPPLPQTPVFTVDSEPGRSGKMERLRKFCRRKNCDGILLSALDDIAWMLDVRALDIEYNPYVISYLLVPVEGDAVWFVLKEKVEDSQTERSFRELEEDGIRTAGYAEIEEIADIFQGSALYADMGSLNLELAENLKVSGLELTDGRSPVQMWKSLKTKSEQEALRDAHLRDGVAMEKFLYWLDRSMADERTVSERDAALKLGQLRARDENYISDSFETISAWGPAAALPHYCTPAINAPLLHPEGLYLCDSGGQYFCGTTDITRTVPLGECSRLEMEDYTLVLKGHIALASAIFPEGTPGCRIDALAREPLWNARRNYGHGTGHGVGFLLGVHEGPQDIRQNLNPVPLTPGMVCSDEPGIYREGQHGVRHENLLLCVEDSENSFGKWLRFETLTLCHFDTSAILTELMTDTELQWLNDYNERVYRAISPLLETSEREWLRSKTLPLTKGMQ
ncbi:MAG: aminopeptidase P family protein [Bacteroidales bacterium]|nr:aminopeptidase P family protein [Bacteroidales bacterium]